MNRPRRGTPRRVPQKREAHRVIRVLTEGAVTEPGYLTQWARRSRNVHLDLADYGMAPLSLVQRARDYQRTNRRSRARQRGRDFDEIWCVFDVDRHPNLAQAIHEARQSDINIALSNPCFELWLLLHLQDQTAYIERHEAQRLAAALGIISAKRLDPSTADHLLASYDDAKRRAQDLLQRHIGNGSDPGSNPSSNVWELIDHLR